MQDYNPFKEKHQIGQDYQIQSKNGPNSKLLNQGDPHNLEDNKVHKIRLHSMLKKDAHGLDKATKSTKDEAEKNQASQIGSFNY